MAWSMTFFTMSNYLAYKFISYITIGYTHLSGKVKTKSWCSPSFKIEWSVFQGDTLSPLTFLLAFNPLIELCKCLSSCGFQLLLPVPNSNGLPSVNSAIYIQWNEASSNEAPGWYYAVVKEYFLDGKAKIEYTDLATEILDPLWTYQKKSETLSIFVETSIKISYNENSWRI